MSLVVLFLLGCLITSTLSAPMEYYATKYDHINVEAILNNKRMVNHYTACLLSKGPCPPDGLEFKRILPDALRTNCIKCTEKQKTVTLRTIRRLKKEYPKIWMQLQAQWDPEDKYVKLFEQTYGDRWRESTTQPSIQIGNRFGEVESTNELSPSPTTEKPKEKRKPDGSVPLTLSVDPSSSQGIVQKPGKKFIAENNIVASASTNSYSSTISYNNTTTKTPIVAIKISPTTTKTPIVTQKITPTTTKLIETNHVKSRPITRIGDGIKSTVSSPIENLLGALGSYGLKVVDASAELTEKVVDSISKLISIT